MAARCCVALSRNRLLLSLALVGGCIWCVDLVRQVQVRPNADRPAAMGRDEAVRPPANRGVRPPASPVADNSHERKGNYQ